MALRVPGLNAVKDFDVSTSHVGWGKRKAWECECALFMMKIFVVSDGYEVALSSV